MDEHLFPAEMLMDVFGDLSSNEAQKNAALFGPLESKTEGKESDVQPRDGKGRVLQSNRAVAVIDNRKAVSGVETIDSAASSRKRRRIAEPTSNDVVGKALEYQRSLTEIAAPRKIEIKTHSWCAPNSRGVLLFNERVFVPDELMMRTDVVRKLLGSNFRHLNRWNFQGCAAKIDGRNPYIPDDHPKFKNSPVDEGPLHVLVQAETKKALDVCVEMVKAHVTALYEEFGTSLSGVKSSCSRRVDLDGVYEHSTDDEASPDPPHAGSVGIVPAKAAAKKEPGEARAIKDPQEEKPHVADKKDPNNEASIKSLQTFIGQFVEYLSDIIVMTPDVAKIATIGQGEGTAAEAEAAIKSALKMTSEAVSHAVSLLCEVEMMHAELMKLLAADGGRSLESRMDDIPAVARNLREVGTRKIEQYSRSLL